MHADQQLYRGTHQPIIPKELYDRVQNIMTEKGIMNSNVPEQYRGMDRNKCRAQLMEDLEKLGLVEKVEDYKHSKGHCYRCDTVIEPYQSTQWFVKMKPLAEPAIKTVEKGEITFYPERWKKVYLNYRGTMSWGKVAFNIGLGYMRLEKYETAIEYFIEIFN